MAGNGGAIPLLIATTNASKVREIAHQLGADSRVATTFAVRGLADLPAGWNDVVEDAPTFRGNAAKKASYFAAYSGWLTLADDSGICVDALDGAPGVYSARYAGEPCDNAANNAKLLREMADIPDGSRGAHFVCTLALCTPTKLLAEIEGRIDGKILRAPRGAHGFGYDPLFLVPTLGRTMAELSLDEKSAISHRGKALRGMIDWLAGIGRHGRDNASQPQWTDHEMESPAAVTDSGGAS
jgi:XTP/dITP diphosphohydrolase